MKLKDINFLDIVVVLKLIFSYVLRVLRCEIYLKLVVDVICKCFDFFFEEVFGDVELYFFLNKRGFKDCFKRIF